MAFDKTPTTWLPNATNGTNQLVLNTADHASPTLTEMSTAEAHVTNGDIRKIAMAFCKEMYDSWVDQAGNQPTKMQVFMSEGYVGTDKLSRTYSFYFELDAPPASVEVADEA
jgi:hypothetical protein